MPVINTGLLEAGLRSDFFEALAQVKVMYEQLCTRVPSTMPAEKYRWLGTVPQMQQWVQGRQAKGLRSESYDVDNLKYEATIEVDRDELDDDQTGQIRIRINELATRAGTHKDWMINQLLENGGAAGFNSYDGVTFFNNAHVSGASGNQDNDLTSTAANGTDPTTIEFKDALKAAIAALLGFKDDQGEPINLGTGGLVVIVPPLMYYTALEAINATMINNTTNIMQGAAQVLLNPFATLADRFYLAKTDGAIKPFIFQDRRPIQFASQAEGSAEEFHREKYLYGVSARYAVAYGEPLRCVRHVFT